MATQCDSVIVPLKRCVISWEMCEKYDMHQALAPYIRVLYEVRNGAIWPVA